MSLAIWALVIIALAFIVFEWRREVVELHRLRTENTLLRARLESQEHLLVRAGEALAGRNRDLALARQNAIEELTGGKRNE